MKQWTVLLAAMSFAMEVVSSENPLYKRTSFGQVDLRSPSNIEHPLLETLRSYEVFQPRQYEDHRHERRKLNISTEMRNEIGLHSDAAYFAFEFQGKTYNLDVFINDVLLPKSFFVADISETGESKVHKPAAHEQNHCYYQGEVRGVSNSKVIMSTCLGLKGCVILPDDSFIFEPLSDTTAQPNQATQHVIYRSQDMTSNKPNATCGQNGSHSDFHTFLDKLKSRSRATSNKAISTKNRNATLPKRYVELLLVVDFALATRIGNSSVIESYVKELANYIDGFYQIFGVGIRIVLSGIEVWSQADRINISSDATTTLNNLIVFRVHQMSSEPSTSAWVYVDTVHLLHGAPFNGTTAGLAPVGTMCTVQSCGVNEDPGNDAFRVATIVAHEMGHNFGFLHDTDQCDCPTDAHCIMAASIGPRTKAIKDWSNCSRGVLENYRESHIQSCLYNVPSPSRVYLGPECGNDIVEGNEECDCGTPEFCKSFCCDPSTCKLLPGAKCDVGLCCIGCQYTSADTECRGTEGNECDFPEYCTGLSADCPEDMHLKNGIPCQNATAYCVKGFCYTHDFQCQKMWGPTAKGTPVCYRLNQLGDRNGNCGQVGGVFLRCDQENLLCGKLMCTGGADRPLRFDIASVLFTNLIIASGVYQCKTPLSVIGVTNNRFLVETGAQCGPNKICSQGGCFRLKPNNCSSVSCNGNGKCDNLDNCHCDAGFSPPDCKVQSNRSSIGNENGDKTTAVYSQDGSGNTTDVFIPDATDNTTDVFSKDFTDSTTDVFSEDTEDDESTSGAFDWRRLTITSVSVIVALPIVAAVVLLTYPKLKAWKNKRAIEDLNVKSLMRNDTSSSSASFMTAISTFSFAKFSSAILKKVDS